MESGYEYCESSGEVADEPEPVWWGRTMAQCGYLYGQPVRRRSARSRRRDIIQYNTNYDEV